MSTEPIDSAHLDLRAALMAALDERAPKVDRHRVGACFDFAAKAHEGQMRRSGEPFVSHPVAVCLILLDLLESRLETSLACGALLHDVVEDTPTTIEELEKRFGREVARLVLGVTKLSNVRFEVAQAETFRRMLLSMARDLRVMFIKLADRLHNMQTIEHLRPEKQRRIALVTRDIYAPLAHRLGIARFKRELEDMSLKILDPEAYEDLTRRISEGHSERESYVEQVRRGVGDGLRAAGIKAEVSGRPKHFYSIYMKMGSGRDLETIYDLLGLRIVTQSKSDCYRALGVVHDRFTPVADRFKDYIASPKNNLYQSLHTTVLTGDGQMVEVQIRTWDMHRTAETGVAAHYVYKKGGKVDEELDAKLGGFVTQTADWQKSASEDEVLDYLRTSLYQEEVFVYTPRREIKRLAKGATALDFAFLIHTEVGQRTVGARVNGEIVPLRYVLHNGDTVEIITSAHARPHEDWLLMLKTASARHKVRHWLRQQRRSDSVALGREMLDRELRGQRQKFDNKELEEAARALGAADLDEMFARLGEGQFSLTQIVRKLVPEKEGFAERLARAPLKALGLTPRKTAGVRIQGLDNVMLSFARCCQPVPGDPVTGIVTLGRGVSVHRQDCPNTFNNQVPAERRVSVEWDAAIGETFPVRLLIYGNDRTSLLADIAKAIAAAGVNVRSAGIASEDRTARGVFVVEVPHLSKLQLVMAAVKKVPGVTRVDRRQRRMGGKIPRASGDGS